MQNISVLWPFPQPCWCLYGWQLPCIIQVIQNDSEALRFVCCINSSLERTVWYAGKEGWPSCCEEISGDTMVSERWRRQSIVYCIRHHNTLLSDFSTNEEETPGCWRDASAILKKLKKIETAIMLVTWNVILERIKKNKWGSAEKWSRVKCSS